MRASRMALIISLVVALSSRGAFALDLGVSVAGSASTETEHALYPEIDFRASHEGADFGFRWDISMDGSGEYGSLFGSQFGYGTVLIKEGGVNWKGGNISLDLGKLPIRDEVDSPYSLALSSLGNSALTASFRYEDDRFFFSDRWFALNYDSNQTFKVAVTDSAGTAVLDAGGNPTYKDQAWPDRSAVLKSYGFKLGELRLGFQDVIIYTNLDYGTASQRGPLFDLEYFIDPAPGFLVQYAETSLDAPWKKASAINDNSLMGFFGAWSRDGLTADAQFIVDDFNMNRFLHPSSYQNPDKLAWTVGASAKTEYGTFRLDQAGATRYVFGSSGYGGEDNLAYGYTYYPDTEFLLGGTMRAMNPEDNYVGYLHGENNLSFMGSWDDRFGELSATASLELTVSGSKSPANPWLTDTSFPSGTKLLDESVLEKKLVLSAAAECIWRDFRFFASGKVGYVWNRLKLTTAEAWGGVDNELENGIAIYKPSDENALIGAITLGGSWALKY